MENKTILLSRGVRREFVTANMQRTSYMQEAQATFSLFAPIVRVAYELCRVWRNWTYA